MRRLILIKFKEQDSFIHRLHLLQDGYHYFEEDLSTLTIPKV